MPGVLKSNKHFAASIFRYSYVLDRLNTNAQLVDFIERHPVPVMGGRQKLHLFVCTECCANGPVDYLEFGVFRGQSLAWWSDQNQNVRSRFFGFDTFEGLPENWQKLRHTMPAGTFSTDGQPPNLADTRISFVKGLFQDTLGNFLNEWQPRGTVVVHCDADLHSSTLFVLTKLNRILASGAIVIFDDFNCSTDVFRAFKDYVAAYRVPFRCLAASTPDYTELAIATGARY